MSQELHKLTVSIEAQIDKFKKACDNVKKEAASAASSADKSLNGISGKNADAGVKKMVDKVKTLKNLMKEFTVSAKLEAGLIKPTEKAAELQTQLEACRESARTAQEGIDALGDEKIGTEQYVRLAEQLSDARTEAERLEQEIRSLGVSGSFENAQPPSFIKNMKAYFAEAKRAASEFSSEFKRGFRDTAPPGLVRAIDRVRSVGTGFRDAGSSVRNFAAGVKNDLARATKGVGSFLSRVSLLRNVRGHANAAAQGFNQIRRRVLSMALGMLSAVAGFSAIRNGMANLEQYSARTRNDLYTLRSALATCQNALATAFAPILSVVTPLLTQLINMVTAAATAVAHFIAALTGHASVVVAKNVGSGVSSGMSGAKNATDAANDSAKEYKRTLMGFDEINKLDDPTGSSGSGGSGGGGGGGGGAGAMFETVDITGAALDWAERFKEAWANADFTEIGGIIGQKFKNALDSIKWDNVQTVGVKIGKSIATGLNGFIETPGLFTSVGTTIAQALNTLVISVNSFTVNFHWTSLGNAVKDSINAFFSTFNFKLAAQTISNIAKGILDTAIAAVSGVDWKQVGAKIIEFVTNIDYVGIAKKIITLLGEAIKGAFNLLEGAVDSLGEWLSNYISSGKWKKDLLNLGSATINASLDITGAAWDLLKTIIKKGIQIAASLVGLPAKLAINAVANFVDWAKGKGFGSTIGGMISSFKDWSKGKGFSNTIGSMIAQFKNWSKGKGFSNVITGMTAAIKVAAASASKKKKKKADGGIFSAGHWRPITAYADGGEPDEGQLFIAREAGAELVGTIGGNTAVMNNDQIVASVSAGVAKAVASVMGNFKGGDTPVYLHGDAAKFFKVMQIEAANYTRATGKPAFPV